MITRLPRPEECQEILGEHQAFCELVTKLYRILAEHTEPAGRVGHLLENLRERLEAHFHDEEQAGVLDEIARRAPQLAEMVQRLVAEHEAFRTQLKGLEALLATEERLTPALWNQLETEFRAFQDRLLHHESVENDLLQQTFTQDMGDKD